MYFWPSYSSFDLMPTEIAEISFASLVFIPSICAGRAVPSHLCFLMAVLNKHGYFKLFLQEVFFVSPYHLSRFLQHSSLVLGTDGGVGAPCSSWQPDHSLRCHCFAIEQAFLLHHRWCWCFPWLLLHWKLVVTWYLPACLQADELL